VIVPFKEAEVKAILQSCAYTKEYNNPLSSKSYRTRRPTAERDTALILLMLDTGLRVSEIARLQIEHVDLQTGAVHILPHGSGQKTKPRVVYLGKSAKRAVWRYLASREETHRYEPLFLTDKGNPLRENQIRHLLKYFGERAGVRDCHPHRFRHTMAIEFIRNRGDVYSLQRILGHSTLTMCLKYLDLSRDDVAEAHRRASPADNWRL
jgi:integrase/recombinase XerD